MAVLAAVVIICACFTAFAAGYMAGVFIKPSVPAAEQRQEEAKQTAEDDRLQKQVENIMNYFGSERGQQGIDE